MSTFESRGRKIGYWYIFQANKILAEIITSETFVKDAKFDMPARTAFIIKVGVQMGLSKV